LYARGFATAAAETKKPAADKAYKVVVIGGGPGGLSGKRGGFIYVGGSGVFAD
jgi:hypothetical protein